MPRRDALSEKKRERLMQEHEQLQKLMLQARSSVRRSSLKNEAEIDPEQIQENNSITPENLQEPEKPVLQSDNEAPNEEPIVTKKEPLTEKDTFPEEAVLQQNPATKPVLTEKELFPNSPIEQEQEPVAPKASVVKVIWPDQNVPATVAERKAVAVENNLTYNNTIAEPVIDEDVHEHSAENVTTYNDELVEEKQPRRRTALFVVLALLVILTGIGGYYAYTINKKNKTAITRRTTPTNAAAQGQQPARTEDSLHTATTSTVNHIPLGKGAMPLSGTTPAKKKSAKTTPSNDTGLSNMLKKFDNVTVIESPTTATNQATPSKNNSGNQTVSNSGLGKYKVISKAYFHDAPDESTRRKAFIIHWNNAVLTPLEEKNGFVYVVFTNHLGQTTKGWLRKQDLQRME